jgi:hypothetical protein
MKKQTTKIIPLRVAYKKPEPNRVDALAELFVENYWRRQQKKKERQENALKQRL